MLTQVGYNCGQRPSVDPGAIAIVIGDVLVGHWTAQTLLHRGAEVVMLGRHDKRLSYLYGRVRGVNTKREDIDEALAPCRGRIHVVDTVGDLETFNRLQPWMARDSHFVSAGFYGESGPVDIQRLRDQEITLHCPAGWTKERMDEALTGICDGWLSMLPLIERRYPAEQAVRAWETIHDPEERCLGVVLEW